LQTLYFTKFHSPAQINRKKATAIKRANKLAPLPKIKIPHRDLALIIFLGLFLNFFISFFINLPIFPNRLMNSYGTQIEKNAMGNIVLLLATVSISPILEELIFRGFLLNFLKKISLNFGIIVSSAIFAIFHGHIIQIAYTFFVGVVFCLVYEKYKTLKAPIFLHLSFNLSPLFLLLLSENEAFARLIQNNYFCGIAAIFSLSVSIFLIFNVLASPGSQNP
jgi:membrane protease YdiL (CAAX protease family)